VLVLDAKCGRIEVALHVLHALSTVLNNTHPQVLYSAARAEGVSLKS
jgi:hypothetical protein